MLTETARARRARCAQPCKHWVICPEEAARRGLRHADFCTFSGSAREQWLALGPSAYEEGACPAGLWPGAVAVNQKPGTRNEERSLACIYAEPECKGCKAVPKVHCHRQDVVLRADACARCGERLPLCQLKIGAVITAWNEGAEVAATIESLKASVKEARLTVILVDDGSTDASCAGLSSSSSSSSSSDLVLVRHGQPRGIGQSRNEGWARARDLGCDVVTFHDAHMRFGAADGGSEGVLEKLAVMAMQRRCIVSSASRGIPSQGRLAGCWLYYDCFYGLQPHWAAKLPPGWQRTPCMMGAGYVLNSQTAQQLEAATGSLWEDTAGRWGFSEQALSVKAYLLGIPVLTNRELVIAHRYRDKNPVPHADRETWKNVARATTVLFGPRVYEERFGEWCSAHVPPPELAAVLAEAAEHHPSAPWPVDPATVWTHLVGEGAPITSPHPDHAWLPQVEAACLALTRNQEPASAKAMAGKPGTRNRVLIWRPGEAMMTVRRLLPNAEITAIELPGHRIGTWKPVCKRAGVALRAATIGAGYPACGPGPWDLVLVNGEMQAACVAAAGPANVLCNSPGLQILCNPAADRRQLEDGERTKEAEQLTPALAEPVVVNRQPTTVNCQPPSVTVCLLNWRRPQNMAPILDSIAAQTVPCRVMLWDNSSSPLPILSPLVDLVVHSGANLGCLPRWWLAGMAKTEWVCSLDDDLAFAAPDALECVLAAAARCPDGVLGAYGVQLVDGTHYRHAVHDNLPANDERVDIVKGRFMLLRRALLET